MSQAPNESNGEPTPNDPDSDVPDEPGSAGRSLDAIFELLAVERRRNALYVLYRHSDPIGLTDLAEEVSSLEGVPTEQVMAGLYHVHLPRLAEEGVVEYDADQGVVCLTASSSRFRAYLTRAAEDEGRPLRRASESATLSEF